MFHVDTMDSFSFFNTYANHSHKVLDAFAGIQFNGRQLQIEISKEGRRKTGGKGGGKYRDKKKGGPRVGKSAPGKFKGKSRRKAQKPDRKGTGGKRRRR